MIEPLVEEREKEKERSNVLLSNSALRQRRRRLPIMSPVAFPTNAEDTELLEQCMRSNVFLEIAGEEGIMTETRAETRQGAQCNLRSHGIARAGEPSTSSTPQKHGEASDGGHNKTTSPLSVISCLLGKQVMNFFLLFATH